MAKVYATPGVYIEEKSAFPNAIVDVPTNVPAFIGYTEKAESGGKSLLNIPVKISSLAEYQNFFGGAPTTTFKLAAEAGKPESFSLEVQDGHFSLYVQMCMFFYNGGRSCYIVAVGLYQEAKIIKTEALIAGIEPLLKETEPSLLVIPEAVMPLLDRSQNLQDQVARLYEVHKAMLKHCGEDMRSRFAILDFWLDRERVDEDTYAFESHIEWGRSAIGQNNLQWGAAYFPWLHTSIVSLSDLSLANIHNPGGADDYLKIEDSEIDGDKLIDQDAFRTKVDAVGQIDSLVKLLDQSVNFDLLDGKISATRAKDIKDKLFSDLSKYETLEAADQKKLQDGLLAMLPTYRMVMDSMREYLSLLPPSAALAGVYSAIDDTSGVFKSPANVSIASVVKPALAIDNNQQEGLNVPLDGKAVNAIRSFPGRGPLIWGARTLDGNSMDWRYISVRRTIIYIEQSIENALKAFVFEPNEANTWVAVKSMIQSFLHNFWTQGGLVGATPDEAFGVEVGLGTTMTANDILENRMLVTARLAISRPAEFVIVNFEQRMGG